MNKNEYIVKAVQLAENPELRKFLRTNLRQKMKHKICDGVAFVQQLENSYRKMVSNYVQKN